MMRNSGDEFSPEEAARRRDEVVRKMANTPPQPRKSPSRPHRGSGKSAAEGRASRKSANVANDKDDD